MGRSALQCLMLGLVALLLISTRAQAAFWDQSPGDSAGKENQAYSQRLVRFDNVSSHYGKEKKAKYEPDKILVKYKAGVPEADKEKQHKKHGSTRIKSLKPLNIHHLKLKKGLSVEAAVKLYQADPDVAYAEPDYIVSAATITPNDTYYSSSGSWGQAYQDMWGLHRMNSGEAWSVTQGSPEVIVAVSDTGLDLNHPDIQANLWINPSESSYNGIDDDGNSFVDDKHGWNFFAGNNDPADDNGHGTHVSGTIAAATDNGLGVAGISWNAKIMALKFLGANGSGSTANGAATIVYAVDNGAKVVNCSWGSEAYSQTLEDALYYAFSRGVVVVTAAGNNSANAAAYFPAGSENVITVAATDRTDAKASFSNHGKAVEVSAPGVEILSLRAGTTDMYGGGTHVVGTNYYRANGTSMAAPHVSGLAALLFSLYPAWTNVQVMGQIVATADDIGNPNIGSGRINALSALTQSATRPRINYLGHSIDDSLANGNGVIDAGETVNVAVSIKNYAAPSTAIVTLSTEDPYVTVVSGTANIGSLGSWQSGNNAASPFLVAVSAQAPPLHRINFTVTITANNGSYTNSDSFGEMVQATVPGWPVATGAEVGNTVALADIDGDGVSEVVTYSDQIYVLKGDGTPLPGWPRPVPEDLFPGPLAVGDLEGNGNPVIVAVGHYNVYAWYGDGTMKEGFPVPVSETQPGEYSGSFNTTLADIDGDGYLEIISAAYRLAQVNVWRHDGTVQPGWPVSIDPAPLSLTLPLSPAVGDLDGDGNPEVVIPGPQDKVFAFHPDGAVVAGWPVSVAGEAVAVSLADLGHDGRQTAFVASASGDIYGFNGDGSPLPGWPNPGYIPSFADVDGDGELEIVSDYFEQMFVYRSDGSLLGGWPQTHLSFSTSAPTLGDVDGDGGIDILARTVYGIYGWRGDGTPLAEFPLVLNPTQEADLEKSMALGEINGDGRIDVVTGSVPGDFNIHAISLPGPYVPRLLPWPMHQRDAQRSSSLVHTPILPTSALSGVLGLPFSQNLGAKGGFAPYLWELSGGALPAGLSLNSSTGEIYGTPGAAGSFGFTIRLSDANGTAVTKAVTAEIQVVAITTANLPKGTLGSSYAQTLAAVGGTTPYSWSVQAGSLPPGLALNPSTGAITGYPTASGSFAVMVQLVDALGAQTTRAWNLEIAPWPDQSVEGLYPHSITLDQAGNLYLTGSKVSPWEMVAAKYGPSGNLLWQRSFAGDNTSSVAVDPAGNVYVAGYDLYIQSRTFLIKYDAAGNSLWTRYRDNGMASSLAVDASGNAYLSGKATSPGNDSFLVKYDGAGGVQWTKTAIDGEPGGMTLDSAGNLYCGFGWSAYKFDPSGVELWSRVYGQTSGGVAVDGNDNLFIAGGSQLSKFDPAGNLLWTALNEEMEIESSGLDAKGNFYLTGQIFNGNNGDFVTMKYDAAGALIWSKTYDSGLDDRSESIAVDKNSAGVYVAGATNGIDLVLLRYAQPAITTTALPEGTVGQSYSYPVTAVGGATPYIWSVTSGALPIGLSVDSSTGVISGTPLSSGTYPVAVRATGVGGFSDVTSLLLTVHPSPTGSLADFSATPLVGEAPLLVDFIDASANVPTSWSWAFGDGGTGGGRTPTHLYTTPGTYAVSLTATGAAGPEAVTKPAYITVLACGNSAVRIAGAAPASFADIMAAYGAAVDYDLIQLMAIEQAGVMELNRDIRVTLKGGYDCGYGEKPVATPLSGSLKVTGGTVKLDYLRFK